MSTRALSFVVSLFLLSGCGGNTPTAPTTDSITVVSILPAAGTTLIAGERVTFTAVVTCTIATAEGGFTALVLQDQRNLSLLQGEERAPEATLRKGTATVTLSQTITIPMSGSTVNALFPIFIDGRDSTRAVAVRSYQVR
jgi:hypothetical protein